MTLLISQLPKSKLQMLSQMQQQHQNSTMTTNTCALIYKLAKQPLFVSIRDITYLQLIANQVNSMSDLLKLLRKSDNLHINSKSYSTSKFTQFSLLLTQSLLYLGKTYLTGYNQNNQTLYMLIATMNLTNHMKLNISLGSI